MEGIGGPVDMDPYSLNGIDPTLDACCQREVSHRQENAAIKFVVVAVVLDRSIDSFIQYSYNACLFVGWINSD
jgi:hypothetical protein